MMESLSFLDALKERISDANYVPTLDDVLHARKPTVGDIVEYRITLDSSYIRHAKFIFILKNNVIYRLFICYRMIDVGGQRKERRHWLQCVDGVTSVIFMVSLAEYDLRLAESKNEVCQKK
jgi:hypothetical protein